MDVFNIREARREIYYWQKGTAGGFITALITAISRADKHNMMRLRIVYPALTLAYEEWQHFGEIFMKKVEEGFKNDAK